ncbi:MAG: hypothetical protein A2Y34_05075 [Spirochaetes bacterium GWC1_27_15]|nr:MAG: hypothetical protein A2Z98_00075 [Spirochaetes bacterium GWB1_27_13]OHD20178.1 MAG: hypothetical protein A2Y34_05075 [Spirochaetes bacterium GWC1_27_15]
MIYENENELRIKADVIIDYINTSDENLPMAVIYVRPETNEVHYEKAIILGITPFADVVYLANLNGKIFIKDALILEHYSLQYKFAIYGKEELAKYPEIITKFEDHFQTDFHNAKIIGAFDAVLKLGVSDEQLFNTMVEEKDFLRIYGQTIKKIDDYFVINYDIPAIIRKYTPKANVFTIVARFKKEDYSFMDINQSIFEQIKKNNAPIISEDRYKEKVEWNEKIKRTYHFSRNHIMAMFDMVDFVIRPNNNHIIFEETPLGRILIEKNHISSEALLIIKDYPLIHISINGEKKLVNLLEEANNKSLEECVELIKSIILP